MSVISELRALLAKATPGPWVGGFAGRADIVHYDGDDIRPVARAYRPENNRLIVAMRNSYDGLLGLAKAVEEYIEINNTHLDPEEKFLAMCEAFDGIRSRFVALGSRE